MEKEPTEMGYEFGRWTGERLATYLANETGINLSGSQIRRILKRKKYSYIWARSRRTEYSARRTRAAKYSLEDKQNPAERAEFKEKLLNYLAISKENPEQLQVWFWKEVLRGKLPPQTLRDETGFSLRVIRRKTWGKKGKRKKLTGQRRRGRVNVMG